MTLTTGLLVACVPRPCVLANTRGNTRNDVVTVMALPPPSVMIAHRRRSPFRDRQRADTPTFEDHRSGANGELSSDVCRPS